MVSKRNKTGLQMLAWGLLLIGLVLVGCQLLTPRQGWNKNKWGPLVPHAKFPGDCGICHVPERWDKLRDDFSFDHEKETGYALEGSHADAACLRCHNDRGPVEVYVARGCAGCHMDPHASSLGMDCEKCHSQISWDPVGLVGEHANTRFPLVGTHAVASCESCHEAAAAGQFLGAPLQCELCHQADLQQAVEPDHLANGWVSDCQRCHNPSTWSSTIFDHGFFPLSGGHGGLDCNECHTTPGIYTGLSPDCYSCHEPEYLGAPDHVSQNYSHDCRECHSIQGWIPAVIDHSFFPLKGGHSGLSCSDCHENGVFVGLPPDCYSCHEAEYLNAPDHQSFGFPQNCEQCHSINAWTPASFQHNSFPLTGHHDVSCTECHTTGSAPAFNCLLNCHSKSDTDSRHREVRNYTYTSSACYDCHPNGRGGD